MEDKSVLGPKIPNVASENDGRTILVHVLEFKTSLLKAVEELHIHRVWFLHSLHVFWRCKPEQYRIVVLRIEKSGNSGE